MAYQREGTPLVVLAGQEYGTGSSRDWAAKGTALLGVKAVVAQSFERIHRSNLVGMGVLPLTFKKASTTWQSLELKGDETISILGLGDALKPRQDMSMQITYADGTKKKVPLLCRIATLDELERNGQVLWRYVGEDGAAALDQDDPANPNGSLRGIAGVCNAAGNVAGLMPHPERMSESILGSDDGMQLIRSFVESARAWETAR